MMKALMIAAALLLPASASAYESDRCTGGPIKVWLCKARYDTGTPVPWGENNYGRVSDDDRGPSAPVGDRQTTPDRPDTEPDPPSQPDRPDRPECRP